MAKQVVVPVLALLALVGIQVLLLVGGNRMAPELVVTILALLAIVVCGLVLLVKEEKHGH